MKVREFVICIFFMGFSFQATAQQPDTLIKKLDSLSKKTDSAGGQNNNTKPAAYNRQTRLNFNTYFILLGSDLKQAFTKPFHMKNRDWKYLGGFALLTGALTFADPPIQKWALNLRNNNIEVRSISSYITGIGGIYELYTLGTLGAYGFIFKNEKIKTTTLLASQAYITGFAAESVMKFLSGRTRPNYYDPNTPAKPTFLGPFGSTSRDYNGSKSNSSFPSGHTTVAFAAATVYAMEYKHHPWVAVVSYSAASLIGVSRITENKHWLTDVLTGAALGYLTGRQVVNNYHRYAQLKSPKSQRNKVLFNLQYNFGRLVPGLVYTFR